MKSTFLRSVLLLLFAAFSIFEGVQAQARPEPAVQKDRDNPSQPDSIEVVADAAFSKKRQKRWLLGDHYRKEWSTPVKVPVLLLETEQGGLVAMKPGGGKQTRTLHLESDKSKSNNFVIRSVEKFPDAALPEELRGTIASSFLKDQISSGHPYAPLVVSALAGAAGIYHTNPQLGFVSYSPLLGAYDSLYGNQLYLLEERPSGDWSSASFFGYSQKIISTTKMNTLLRNGPQFRLDEAAFLRARLLDILIGDWDRHEDQWAWASFDIGGSTVFRPIPKDRDQAFARLDGVIPWIGTRKWALRRTQNFDATIADLPGLLWSGRNLDRAYLTELEWTDWKSKAFFLQQVWTDEVICAAVKKLPETLFQISGAELIRKLKRRRDDLPKYVEQYYSLIAREVEWAGTEQNDLFSISLLSDTAIQVIQYLIEDEEQYTEVRKRVFHSKETKEIRIFGIGGKDRLEMRNDFKLPIRIRYISSPEGSQYTDHREYRFGKKPLLYDSAISKSHVTGNIGLRHDYDTLTHRYASGHHYNKVLPLFMPGFNPDDGLFIGGGVRFTKHKWGQSPFSEQHDMAANYAFSTGAYNFLYKGVFSKAIRKWDLFIEGRLNQPNFALNYYGLGNETKLETRGRSYYRIRVRQAELKGGLQRAFGRGSTLQLGGEVFSSRTESWDKRFVSTSNAKLDSSDF